MRTNYLLSTFRYCYQKAILLLIVLIFSITLPSYADVESVISKSMNDFSPEQLDWVSYDDQSPSHCSGYYAPPEYGYAEEEIDNQQLHILADSVVHQYDGVTEVIISILLCKVRGHSFVRVI